ncbi:MAG: cytochrome D1 domain-containing protein, partial [Acidobacteriota bacterium]
MLKESTTFLAPKYRVNFLVWMTMSLMGPSLFLFLRSRVTLQFLSQPLQYFLRAEIQHEDFTQKQLKRVVEPPQALLPRINLPSFGDEQSFAVLGFDDTIPNQVSISLRHGVGIDDQLFGQRPVSLGTEIRINSIPYRLVGFMKEKNQNSSYSGRDADQIWIADLNDAAKPKLTKFENVGRQPYDALVTPDGRHYIAGL